jgi:hypothetical protein
MSAVNNAPLLVCVYHAASPTHQALTQLPRGSWHCPLLERLHLRGERKVG